MTEKKASAHRDETHVQQPPAKANVAPPEHPVTGEQTQPTRKQQPPLTPQQQEAADIQARSQAAFDEGKKAFDEANKRGVGGHNAQLNGVDLHNELDQLLELAANWRSAAGPNGVSLSGADCAADLERQVGALRTKLGAAAARAATQNTQSQNTP